MRRVPPVRPSGPVARAPVTATRGPRAAEPAAPLASARGQATVELVALLPLLVAVALGAFTVLAAGRAREQAGAAAHAGAVALMQDRDARAAARASLPAGARVTVSGPRVTVRVRPHVPLLARALEARASAVAGGGP